MTQANLKTPTPSDLYADGAAARAAGDKSTAMVRFQEALTIDAGYVPAWDAMAEVYLEDGYFLHALDTYARAIHVNPDSTALKDGFMMLLRGTGFRVYNPQAKRLVLACLQDEKVDFFGGGQAWYSLLKGDPAFKSVLKALEQKTYRKFRAAFDSLPDPTLLFDPYFIEGLRRVIAPDLRFERALTHLRRALLEMLHNDRARFDQGGYIRLTEALAHYCFYTGYIFDLTPEETALADALQPVDAVSVAMIACYRSLFHLAGAQDLALQFQSTLPDLIRTQIDNIVEERQTADSIPALTAIDNDVSQSVRQQYEEFPYPRWTSFSKRIYNEKTEGTLRGKKARLLVAGTGTGREAIELASLFDDSSVLAVDLSRASLAYGAIRAKRFGINNVEFRHADILGLSSLNEQFDFIASSGVLHHMDDPYRGWSVLVGLLKPGGLMRIALYSDIARQSILEARNAIARHGYASDADGIRRFRRDAKKRLKRKTYKLITRSPEYFVMQECRDLLFHVHERYFTAPMIRDHLDRLGLTFLGFGLPPAILKQFARMHPGGSPLDLALWDAFERKYPETFMGMYRFWCRKA
jgi:SAM-dependent methyltransferase/tetratricopeptide (TPR) repeat protein